MKLYFFHIAKWHFLFVIFRECYLTDFYIHLFLVLQRTSIPPFLLSLWLNLFEKDSFCFGPESHGYFWIECGNEQLLWQLQQLGDIVVENRGTFATQTNVPNWMIVPVLSENFPITGNNSLVSSQKDLTDFFSRYGLLLSTKKDTFWKPEAPNIHLATQSTRTEYAEVLMDGKCDVVHNR